MSGSEGYGGDVSSVNGKSSDGCSNEDNGEGGEKTPLHDDLENNNTTGLPCWDIPSRRKAKHQRQCMIERPLNVAPPKRLASSPSPIHPDIDISLTHHITSQQLSATPLVTASIPLETLSSMVTEYFACVHREKNKKPGSSRSRPASMEAEKATQRFLLSQQPRGPLHRLPRTFQPEARQRSEKETVESLAHTIEDTAGELIPMEMERQSQQPKTCDSVELLDQSSKALRVMSKEHRSLEDALALTDSPRLLIEASPPYRVVHANVAFSHNVIGTATNIQRWTDRQHQATRKKHPSSRRTASLLKALRELIPDETVPLMVYPVSGRESKRPTHYLIEANEDGDNKETPHRRRRQSKRSQKNSVLMESSRTIG